MYVTMFVTFHTYFIYSNISYFRSIECEEPTDQDVSCDENLKGNKRSHKLPVNQFAVVTTIKWRWCLDGTCDSTDIPHAIS